MTEKCIRLIIITNILILNLDEYRQFQHFRQEREAFFEWLEATATRNAERNVGLSDEEVLAIIEPAREEVASAVG